MQLGGLQKMTLLDFPGRVACTVFTVGCNWRCPFCHNASLAKGDGSGYDGIDPEDFFAFLNKRKGILDGVAITGGEPLMQPDLPAFLRQIRALGYAVKLDTNGTFPDRLEAVLAEGLCDMVAMDIKNSPAKYNVTCGMQQVDFEKVRRSAELLMKGKVPFEFRTTVVDELHDADDFRAIGEWIRGDEPYFLQCFTDSGELMTEGFHAPEKAKLLEFEAICRPFIPNVALRGVS